MNIMPLKKKREKKAYTYEKRNGMTLNISVNITTPLSALYFIFLSETFVLTTAFQHNYMLGFPICCILIWNEASMNARVVIHDNLTDGIKHCII